MAKKKRFTAAVAVRAMSRAAIGKVPTVKCVPNKRKATKCLSNRDLQEMMTAE